LLDFSKELARGQFGSLGSFATDMSAILRTD